MSVEYVYPSQSQYLERICGDCVNGQKPLISGDALSFKDIIDTVNPLQQLPVVGTIYRAASGDTISTFSRLIGGALLGGPVGFMVAAASAAFEAATGSDIGSQLVAMVTGGSSEHQFAAATTQYQKTAQLS